MRDTLASAAKAANADFVEIRVEDTHTTGVEFRGPTLEGVGKNTAFGGCVRALVGGCWGFASFCDVSALQARVEEAVRKATLAAAWAEGGQRLAEVPIVNDVVGLEPICDPRLVPLADKVALMAEYNDIVLSCHRRIASSNVVYTDRHTVLHYANSEGTSIVQEKLELFGKIVALASRAGDTQTAQLSFGSSNDFSTVRGLHERVSTTCATACALLEADAANGGEYTVVLDPALAGVFTHEAFGHLSEADGMYENDSLREVMALGRTLGGRNLSIADSGLTPGARGYLRYDDEGVAAQRTQLIHEGKLVGRLHSRCTAAAMGERPTGNARALDYRFAPIVRMRNTSIEPGEATLADMLAGVRSGIYAKGCIGGETWGEMFTFTAREAYLIRDGVIGPLVRNATLTGNVFVTLANIDLVGSDFTALDGPGGCGKAGQSPLPTSQWSPHIRIQKALVGGK